MIKFIEEDWTAVDGQVLYRIQAANDMPWHGVKAGDLGGYVYLSEEAVGPLAWVTTDAVVAGKSKVGGTSLVTGYAIVTGESVIRDSVIDGTSTISNSIVLSDSKIYNSRISNGSSIYSSGIYESEVCGSVRVECAFVRDEDIAQHNDLISVWGTMFPITIGPKNISISEKTLPREQWLGMTDPEILGLLGNRGVVWWREWRPKLIALTLEPASPEDCWHSDKCNCMKI